ncbi:MAG: NifB/NifX family molybdenum-iron cluster-binding protein [Candidatus Saccharicenans sp.]|nr:NifB/NifX family molybdenum-iron cluster-binding protein [Candidatus Saccharicenans sp.]MDH7575734.1 NifB/NifX family molybdenum-iron cluster-binding protein [Candidatus Saccharicenans sp.]
MTKKIIMAVEDQRGLGSRLAGHFGRAPYFALVEIDERGEIADIKTIANFDEHFGGRGHAHENILSERPDILIVYGMGPRGLASMAEAGVTVLKAEGDTVQEVLVAYREKRLKELTEGCDHGHHCH